jgi:hypothetical protein
MLTDDGFYSPQPTEDSSPHPGYQSPSGFLGTGQGLAGTAAAQLVSSISTTAVNEELGKMAGRLSQTDSIIRPYFRVNVASILHRIRRLIFPFTAKDWSRAVNDNELALPITNPNLPELYSPLVFMFVFLLISSVLLAVKHVFTFEKVSLLFLKCVVLLAFEVGGAKVAFFAVGVPMSFPILTLAADLGSISFYLSLAALVSWSSFLRFVVLAYCGAASLLWTVRTLNPRSGVQPAHPSPAHTYSIFAVAAVHAILPFFIVLNLSGPQGIPRVVPVSSPIA